MKWILWIVVVLAIAIDPTRSLFAQGPSAGPRATSLPGSNGAFDADETLNGLVRSLVLKQIPHTWTRDKDWGHQSERWDGLEWERDGLRIETRRRKKKVNHGTWKKYSARLLDPRRRFDIRLTDVRQTPEKHLAFRVTFSAPIKLHARQSEWVKGVQLYSLSADGHAAIRLAIDMELAISVDPQKMPPDLILKPRALAADLIVDEFRIDRVSKLGGEFAQQVTRLVRRELDKEIAEKERELVSKINKEIAEDQEKLRLSVADAIDSEWTEKALPFLPSGVRGTIHQNGIEVHDRTPNQ